MATEDRKPNDAEVLRGATELVKVLRGAQIIGKLQECTPDGLKVDLHKHDTAVHCHIYLVDGSDELLVWYKTNWVNSGYEFNEKGKVIGLQPGCEFAEPYLIHLFTAAIDALEKKDAEDRVKAEKKIADTAEKQREKVERFAKKFG